MEKQWRNYEYTVQLEYADGRVTEVFGSDDAEEVHADYVNWFNALDTGEAITWGSYRGGKLDVLGRFTYADAVSVGI